MEYGEMLWKVSVKLQEMTCSFKRKIEYLAKLPGRQQEL
jgi:hypothetical protein